MIDDQVMASASTNHQTLADDERKRHFSFFSNPRQIRPNFPPAPSILAPHLPVFLCFNSVLFFFHRSASFFTSGFRNDVRNFARYYISII